MIRNSKLIDSTHGVFSVLELVTLRLGWQYCWLGEDIDDELTKGAIFWAFRPADARAGLPAVGSIQVSDGSNDPTEPDVSTLEQDGVAALDAYLHEAIQAQLAADGMELIQWMSSQLNQSGNFKNLATVYVVNDQGQQRRFIAFRMKVKGRKIVVIGTFDFSKEDVFEEFFVNVMRNMVVIS